jgi:hypothetical protein
MMYLKIKNMFKMFDLRQFGKIKMVQIKLMLDEDNKIHLLHVNKYWENQWAINKRIMVNGKINLPWWPNYYQIIVFNGY